jgi:hypothetical protein
MPEPNDDKEEQRRLLEQFSRMDEFFAEECEPGEHVFDVDGPPPWKCAFCGYAPEPVK